MGGSGGSFKSYIGRVRECGAGRVWRPEASNLPTQTCPNLRLPFLAAPRVARHGTFTDSLSRTRGTFRNRTPPTRTAARQARPQAASEHHLSDPLPIQRPLSTPLRQTLRAAHSAGERMARSPATRQLRFVAAQENRRRWPRRVWQDVQHDWGTTSWSPFEVISTIVADAHSPNEQRERGRRFGT